jgi:hypothetical protein
VELAVGGDDARAVEDGERGQPSRDELVRVLTERDVLRAIAEEAREARADRRSLPGRTRPLVVDELGGIEPGALLRVEPDVRPRLVRVAGQEETFGNTKSRVMPGEGIVCQSSVSDPQSTVLDFRIPNPESRAPDPGSRIPDPGSRVPGPVLLSPSTQEAP